jgi:hypothetical protein
VLDGALAFRTTSCVFVSAIRWSSSAVFERCGETKPNQPTSTTSAIAIAASAATTLGVNLSFISRFLPWCARWRRS